MRNALNELQSGSVVDESLIQNRNENYGNDFNNTGRQMNELSSNTSNNIINENN